MIKRIEDVIASPSEREEAWARFVEARESNLAVHERRGFGRRSVERRGPVLPPIAKRGVAVREW